MNVTGTDPANAQSLRFWFSDILRPNGALEQLTNAT